MAGAESDQNARSLRHWGACGDCPSKLVNEILREMDPEFTGTDCDDLYAQSVLEQLSDVVRNHRWDITLPGGGLSNAPTYLPRARERGEKSVLVRSDR